MVYKKVLQLWTWIFTFMHLVKYFILGERKTSSIEEKKEKEKEKDVYVPPKNTATQEQMAKRKVMDQRRW